MVNNISLPMLAIHFGGGATKRWPGLQMHPSLSLHSVFGPNGSVHWIASMQASLIFEATKYMQKTQLLIKFCIENYL
jgi:hypothetical protein